MGHLSKTVWECRPLSDRSPGHGPDLASAIISKKDQPKSINNIDYKDLLASWAPFQYPIRRRIVRSREVSMPRDLYLESSDRSEIWQTPEQHCCRHVCQISQRYDNLNCRSHGFETSRDLTMRRLIGYWNGALEKTTFRNSAQWYTHYHRFILNNIVILSDLSNAIILGRIYVLSFTLKVTLLRKKININFISICTIYHSICWWNRSLTH